MPCKPFVALLLAAASLPALAEEAPPPLTTTVTFVSDYIFRGMTQTWGKPALQASVDYNHESGLYAGIWGSNVSGDAYAGGNLEIDIYGGYNGKINDDWGYTAGFLHFMYPSANYNKTTYVALPSQRYNSTEVNVGVNYKWVSLKVSQTIGDLLGFNENTGYTSGTRGSTYVDLSANVPLAEDWTLGLHAGRQHITATTVAPTLGGSTTPDFTDYRLSLTRTLPQGWNVSAAYTHHSNPEFWNRSVSPNNVNDTYDIAKDHWVLSVGRTF